MRARADDGLPGARPLTEPRVGEVAQLRVVRALRRPAAAATRAPARRAPGRRARITAWPASASDGSNAPPCTSLLQRHERRRRLGLLVGDRSRCRAAAPRGSGRRRARSGPRVTCSARCGRSSAAGPAGEAGVAGPRLAAPSRGRARARPGPVVPFTWLESRDASTAISADAAGRGDDHRRRRTIRTRLTCGPRRRRRARLAGAPASAASSAIAASRSARQRVDVRERVVVAQQPEEQAPVVGHDRDPERRVEHQRHLRIERLQPPAHQVQRHLRPGHVGHGQVEEALARLQPRGLVEDRRRGGVGEPRDRLRADGLPGLLQALHRARARTGSARPGPRARPAAARTSPRPGCRARRGRRRRAPRSAPSPSARALGVAPVAEQVRAQRARRPRSARRR